MGTVVVEDNLKLNWNYVKLINQHCLKRSLHVEGRVYNVAGAIRPTNRHNFQNSSCRDGLILHRHFEVMCNSVSEDVNKFPKHTIWKYIFFRFSQKNYLCYG